MRHPTETMLTALYGWLCSKCERRMDVETQSALQPIGKWQRARAGPRQNLPGEISLNGLELSHVAVATDGDAQHMGFISQPIDDRR